MRERSRQVLAVVCVSTVVCGLGAGLCPAQLQRDYNVKPVPFNQVHVEDGFWTPRLETSRKVTIPYCFEKCEETDRISNFEKAGGLKQGKHEGIYFNDSDVYKVMEGAAYSLCSAPALGGDPRVEGVPPSNRGQDARDTDGWATLTRLYLDKLIAIMAAAQWEDGYLYTFYSVPERQPQMRWTDIRSKHEQYCMGHMFEAAVAHYQVTGSRAFLDVAVEDADLICEVFGPGRRTDPPGHEEIEIGLCKLYRATGDGKYLDEAKFLLDQRGRKGTRGPNGDGGLYGAYAQDHIPVTEQKEAVGHSVRAAYLYTGMADVAALTGDMKYVDAIDAIWNDVVGTKLFITGGIGATGGNEGFGGPYELPNLTAYCETCASIANIFWNHRMFLMRGDGKYMDVLERTLYNAALSGISLEGDRFFYPNVLESTGRHERSPWFGCACCPSNVARFIPSVPGYTYARKERDIYVNLFIGGDATVETAGNRVKLTQKTEYPWEGAVSITVEPEKEESLAILVRVPGWARNEPVPSDLYRFQDTVADTVSFKVNGRRVSPPVEKGYARIERKWQQGDTIALNLPMPIRRIVAHREIKADQGRVALQRGPVVYCLEGPDNEDKVLNLVIPDNAKLKAERRPSRGEESLAPTDGVVVLTGRALVAKRSLDGSITTAGTRPFTAIPYYAWAHRGQAEMTVWPAREPQAARPEPADTLTYRSKTTASFVHVSLDAIKDQNLPTSSSDNSPLHLDFWPHKGTTEWVQFKWDKPHELSSVQVYWLDDTGRGECHLPKSWQVLYRTAEGQFEPVKNATGYGVGKDTFNKVGFKPVRTDALKIEIALLPKWSAGVQEVVIE